MPWDYKLARQAFKNLKKFPKKEQERIFVVLEGMKSDPFFGDIKLMRGEDNLYRRRKGNYRIYFRPIQPEWKRGQPPLFRKLCGVI